jgi:hypothetical protein
MPKPSIHEVPCSSVAILGQILPIRTYFDQKKAVHGGPDKFCEKFDEARRNPDKLTGLCPDTIARGPVVYSKKKTRGAISLGNFSEKSKICFAARVFQWYIITKNIRLYNIVSFTSLPFVVDVEGLVPVLLPLITHPAPGPTTSLH